jgi:inner membrane protein
MSSIVGHALAGVSVASVFEHSGTRENSRRLFGLAALLSITPDLDVLIYMAFRPLGMIPHRGITHTIVFALFAGVFMAIVCRRFLGLTYARMFLIVSAVLLSHSLLDYLMGCGPAVPFFWPISEQGFLLPFRLVPTAYYSLSAGGLLSVAVSLVTLVGMLLEIVIFLPLIILSQRRSGASRLHLAIISALGIVLTLLIYNA